MLSTRNAPPAPLCFRRGKSGYWERQFAQSGRESPMGGVLVIVPCGKRKIWDHDPTHGPAKAEDAYTGTLFRLNREYAEKYGDRWLILSAKYGFVPPEFEIPESYDVAFNKKRTNPIGSSQ